MGVERSGTASMPRPPSGRHRRRAGLSVVLGICRRLRRACRESADARSAGAPAPGRHSDFMRLGYGFRGISPEPGPVVGEGSPGARCAPGRPVLDKIYPTRL